MSPILDYETKCLERAVESAQGDVLRHLRNKDLPTHAKVARRIVSADATTIHGVFGLIREPRGDEGFGRYTYSTGQTHRALDRLLLANRVVGHGLLDDGDPTIAYSTYGKDGPCLCDPDDEDATPFVVESKEWLIDSVAELLLRPTPPEGLQPLAKKAVVYVEREVAAWPAKPWSKTQPLPSLSDWVKAYLREVYPLLTCERLLEVFDWHEKHEADRLVWINAENAEDGQPPEVVKLDSATVALRAWLASVES